MSFDKTKITFAKIHVSVCEDIERPAFLNQLLTRLKFKQIFIMNSFPSLQICSLLRGGIAERGGVRVGHRIIEINSQSVVAVPHERIVNLLATSVGEVLKNLILCLHYAKSDEK